MDNYRGTTDYYNLRVEDQSQRPQRAASSEKNGAKSVVVSVTESEQTGSAVPVICVLWLEMIEGQESRMEEGEKQNRNQ